VDSLSVGSIILIDFPYADFKTYKKRPALVVAKSSLDTIILCQITSRRLPDVPAVTLTKNDFQNGNLPITSFARIDKLFTIDVALAEQNQLGLLSDQKIGEIRIAIRKLFR
jgi:mRNA interferase MazF